MSLDPKKLTLLRTKITEGLRIQKGIDDVVTYIDTSHAVSDICARQNHAIFARRGCGKTLLLHYSAQQLEKNHIRRVYLNCENFKHHSFPNVLIEILDALFREIEKNLPGWFGKKKKSRELITQIRRDLQRLRSSDDSREEQIRQKDSSEDSVSAEGKLGLELDSLKASTGSKISSKASKEIERTYKLRTDKLRNLNIILPRLKERVEEFFELSNDVRALFLELDDLYHLKKTDQPFVMDYIHRLCKDLPIYFKIATLRHASSLYIDLDGQPIGAQERHDYQPINIDYTFSDFKRTADQNLHILYEYGKAAGIKPGEMDSLFKGEGFNRLVMAGGGVPRDTLSLFLEALANTSSHGTEKIGKDDIRIMSKANFERRIAELKQDSEGGEQDILMRGIYVLRDFCLTKKTNIFLVAEKILQQDDALSNLVYRLLDYRVIHSAASALTHKSQSGTYQAFAIDIGCYAHLRKLDKRFNEIDVSSKDAKDKIRSAPILDSAEFGDLLKATPSNVENALLVDEDDE